MNDEWLRWVGGIIGAAALGLLGWFARHNFTVQKELRDKDEKLEDEILAGDRRLHERIDKLVTEIQQMVKDLLKEAKEDRHKVVGSVDAKMSEMHLDNMRFREKIYDQLVALNGKVSEMRGAVIGSAMREIESKG